MLSAAGLFFLGLSAIGVPVGAHSDLEASSPGVGELVTEPVDTVELDFASDVVADSATVAVVVDAVEVPASVAGGSASDILNVTLEDAVRSDRLAWPCAWLPRTATKSR